MKPQDILPDNINSVEKDGVVVRKGTLGAFTENIRMIDESLVGTPQKIEAVQDLYELIPALIKLKFFDYYKIRSDKVRKIILERYPNLPLD
jgi:hypothetical protein